MQTKLISHILAFTLASSAIGASAATATSQQAVGRYGQSAPAGASERTIMLTPHTRAINVINGETVTFDKDGKQFTWHVDAWNNVMAFDLGAIAPAAMRAGGIEVYVAANNQNQK